MTARFKNPEGHCCLGNVAKVIREAEDCSADGDQSQLACCPPKAPQSHSDAAARYDRTGSVAALGALGAAALSSTCCWLPLLLIGLGVSSAGVGAFFEAWRVPLIAVSVLPIGLGFYVVYIRDAYVIPAPKSGRAEKQGRPVVRQRCSYRLCLLP